MFTVKLELNLFFLDCVCQAPFYFGRRSHCEGNYLEDISPCFQKSEQPLSLFTSSSAGDSQYYTPHDHNFSAKHHSTVC